ncbi:P-loop containing nucleoside triphosphate hydrolase protein [Mycena crocata]|nr:P-loop containing nucleoside triphosphate hydrolase protein [Mycena crocata]
MTGIVDEICFSERRKRRPQRGRHTVSPHLTPMRSPALASLLRLISRLGLASGRSWTTLLAATLSFIRKIGTHPQVAELFRFVFLGTVVETGRKVAEKIAEFARHFFVVKAEFSMGDFAYDWVVNYLEHHRVWNESRSFKVVARNAALRPYQSSSLGKIDGHPDPIYEPATAQSPALFRWRGYWMSISKDSAGLSHYDTAAPNNTESTLTVTMHSSDREVLADLIECARQRYVENGTSRVTVHLTDTNGRWAKTVTKSRRALSTLILPTDIKETILADAREFLASEKWYKVAGIPHRRGYLLYGAPGTGKSSTIHAIAGELGLEIYFISLANPGIDDFTLGRLISDTPSRSILLIEDIDCAFPSRDEMEDEEDEVEKDRNGNPIRLNMMPPKSAVTLSGLLNVLDSVSSEEGRLTFATTNHIGNLDPALIRAGRMDLKIKYGLATTDQISSVFKVFFPARDTSDPEPEDPLRTTNYPFTSAEIDALSTSFAAAIPNEAYSIAQVQGYLLTRKRDPVGALEGAKDWVVAQQMERRMHAESKRRWRAEIARWHRGYDQPSPEVDAWERVIGAVEEGADRPVATESDPGVTTQTETGGGVESALPIVVLPGIVDLLVGSPQEVGGDEPQTEGTV